MKSFIVAFVVAAALLLAVVDGRPHIPKRRICSIQANGTSKFKTKYTLGVATGNCSMKRVNEYAIYNYSEDGSGRRYGFILVRADVGTREKACEGSGFSTKCSGSSLTLKYSLSDFEYSEDYNPIPDIKDCYCFVYKSGNTYYAAMYFTKDDRMKLVAEWFNLGSDNFVSFFYDDVQEYEHNHTDRTFSLNDGSDWSSVATKALTQYCDDVVSSSDSSSADASSMILPSFIAFIATIVAYLLF